MKENKLRRLLKDHMPSVATRVESVWPTIIEIVGATGQYDYIEFVAEYAPYTTGDLENMARAAELHNMASMIKVDLQNRAYVAQKAMACGFQAVLLVDHKTAGQVAESVKLLKPDCPEDAGHMGYPNTRWIGYQPYKAQMDYAKMARETVIALMIEKKDAMDNIEEICAVPGIDMLQFGPSDYSMSNGWNLVDHREELKAIERRMIAAALAHGIEPRCEIYTAEEAKYYMDLGVRHFSIGDELKVLSNYWAASGSAMRRIAEGIKP